MMITASEWQAANDRVMEDARHKLGDAPGADDLIAYKRGELSAHREQQVREWLVCNPDVARALLEPFPTTGAEPGDPDFLSDADFAQHWTAMQRKMTAAKERGGGRVVQFWRISTAVAATVALTLGALLWQAQWGRQPQILQEEVLIPDGHRGPAEEAAVLAGSGKSVILIAPLIGHFDYSRYRLQIEKHGSRAPVWSGVSPPPGDDNVFAIEVPRRFLAPARYRLVIYGIGGDGEKSLASYSIRIPR
jgi:hypothetical protein